MTRIVVENIHSACSNTPSSYSYFILVLRMLKGKSLQGDNLVLNPANRTQHAICNGLTWHIYEYSSKAYLSLYSAKITFPPRMWDTLNIYLLTCQCTLNLRLRQNVENNLKTSPNFKKKKDKILRNKTGHAIFIARGMQ